MREVKIEEYWPLIVKGTEEFGQIAVAENPEFNELSRCVYQVLKDSFLLAGEEEHAGEYGVSRWEKMLGLSHSADMSLDERKAAILTYLSVKLPYTWRVLKQMLVGLLGEGNFELTFDNDAQKITIALSISTTQSQIEAVNTLIERVVPQNLEIEMAWTNGLPFNDDYMPIEYVDMVKIFSHDSVITTNALDVELDVEFVYKVMDYSILNVLASTIGDSVYGQAELSYYFYSYYQSHGLRLINNSSNAYFRQHPVNQQVGEYQNKLPNTNNKRAFYHIHDLGYTVDGKFYEFKPTDLLENINWGRMRVGCAPSASGNHVRMWRMTVRQNGIMTANLLPCVRLVDGAPGLYCTVYNKFYEQTPTMTLELEDDEYNGVSYLEPPMEVTENE